MSKQTIRNQIKEKLASIPEYQLKAESEKICSTIINSKDYKNCTTLLAYMPLPDEADITPVISDALVHSKSVYLPRITPGTNQMEFYRFTTGSRTDTGSYGITEPEADETQNFLNYLKKHIQELNSQQILILVPGRAFTKDGRRLGRGKGFYDIYFSRLTDATKNMAFSKNIKKSGVCFASQLVADIPTTPDDVLMDSVFRSKS